MMKFEYPVFVVVCVDTKNDPLAFGKICLVFVYDIIEVEANLCKNI